MRLRVTISVVFSVWCSYFVFRQEPDLANAGFVALIGASILGWMAYARSQRRQDDEFTQWLKQNVSMIEQGGAVFRGRTITPETRLTSYWVAISVVVCSELYPSRLFIMGEAGSASQRLLLTIASLVYGWWGFPWGPIFTVKAVWRNVCGGNVITVGSLLPARSASSVRDSSALGIPSLAAANR